MGPKRILVVDDSVLMRRVAQKCLETVGGWQVLTAGSGEEALAIAVAERPDAILLDVVMPGMDGISTYRRLRDDPATGDIPVVFLTASDDPAEMGESGIYDEVGVIPKPYDPLKLPRQLAGLLRW